ncbi:hypothetical protein B0I27_102423 [Arcticibacter pallidicorallinus]|uniref:Uncharacterized protein n=1 Tax=Arcticibacter pallidicorallinus TaxID=1259464 RepID=A0A2T0U9P2_9SPHI|nr:hypothetical protein B0I27_102423 [Arcticibacter pallidicorallinus]
MHPFYNERIIFSILQILKEDKNHFTYSRTLTAVNKLLANCRLTRCNDGNNLDISGKHSSHLPAKTAINHKQDGVQVQLANGNSEWVNIYWSGKITAGGRF